MTLKQETVLVGLTGPLGSGSSFFAKHINNQFGFPVYTLSDFIREECKKRTLGESPQTLQDIGNELRAKNGEDYLVKLALDQIADSAYEGPVVIDSIRNLGEVKSLRNFPNFFLIATDAPKEIRKSRKGNHPEFDEYDKRDSEEDYSYGQQVAKCVYYSDIVVDNSKNRPPGSDNEEEFIDSQVKYYINLILDPGKVKPNPHETIMTLAYSVSLRSSCLKRKVGAVITTNEGDIISTGYNEVPLDLDSCKAEYGQCFKDKTRVENLRKIIKCPTCGGDLNKLIVCSKCDKKYEEYNIICTENRCFTELDTSIICSNCGEDIINKFDIKDISRCRALHAEENAIIKLTKFGGGVPLKDARIYVTTFPCKLCANKIREVGIKEVVFVEPYPDVDSISILKEGVEMTRFYGVKSKAYFRLYDRV